MRILLSPGQDMDKIIKNKNKASSNKKPLPPETPCSLVNCLTICPSPRPVYGEEWWVASQRLEYRLVCCLGTGLPSKRNPPSQPLEKEKCIMRKYWTPLCQWLLFPLSLWPAYGACYSNSANLNLFPAFCEVRYVKVSQLFQWVLFQSRDQELPVPVCIWRNGDSEEALLIDAT